KSVNMFEPGVTQNGYGNGVNGHFQWNSQSNGQAGDALPYDAQYPSASMQYGSQSYESPGSAPDYAANDTLDVDLAASASLGNNGGYYTNTGYSAGTGNSYSQRSPGAGSHRYEFGAAAAAAASLDDEGQPYANLPPPGTLPSPPSQLSPPMSAQLAMVNNSGYARSIGSQSQQQQQQHHYHLLQRDFSTVDGRIRQKQLQPPQVERQQQHEYVNYRDPDVVAAMKQRAASVDGAAGGLSRSDKFGTLASLNSTGRYASSTIGDSRQRILPAYSTEQQYDPAFANPGYSDLGDFYPIENGAARAVSPAYSQSHRSFVSNSQVSHAVAETILLESRPPQTAEPQSSSYRDPELPDLLQLLRSGSDEARCHAAAYLQHLTFCEEDTKTRVRTSGGIILLVNLLARPGSVNLRLGVLGALRNLSFGLGQEENRREMARCGLLANLCALVESAEEQEVRELATAVLWNLSASPALRKDMLDTCVTPLVNRVLLPHAGLERAPSGEFNSVQREIYWTGVFCNATGALRCLSAYGDAGYGRKCLRACPGLVESVIQVLRCAVRNTDLDRKSIENCVCLLRNLLFACQETADPNYQPAESIAPAQLNSNSKSGKSGGGCFGGKSSSNGGPSSSSSKKKQQPQQKPASKEATPQQPLAGGGGRISLLWQAGTLSSVLLPIIADCANPDTLEAAAGAVQNLAACDWQPSVEFRAQIRRDKGLPLLVELLSLDADRVVRTAATALRNLALEAQSLKLIGQYALEALTSRLPRRNSPIANSPETYAAVIAALYAVVKTSPVYARRLAELGGPSGLILVRDAPSRYGQKSSAFAARLLDSMQQLLGKDVQLLSLQNRQQQQQQQQPQAQMELQQRQPSAAAPAAAAEPPPVVRRQASTEPTYAQIDRQKKMQQRAQMPPPQQQEQQEQQPEPDMRQHHYQHHQHHLVHSQVYEQAADSWV
ncbi:hypothetical protein BOX15_Mlig012207g1, partial [Macrostomum lignano]